MLSTSTMWWAEGTAPMRVKIHYQHKGFTVQLNHHKIHAVTLQQLFWLNPMSASSACGLKFNNQVGKLRWKCFYQRHSANKRPSSQLPMTAIFHSFHSPFRGMFTKRQRDLEGADGSQLGSVYIEAIQRR